MLLKVVSSNIASNIRIDDRFFYYYYCDLLAFCVFSLLYIKTCFNIYTTRGSNDILFQFYRPTHVSELLTTVHKLELWCGAFILKQTNTEISVHVSREVLSVSCVMWCENTKPKDKLSVSHVTCNHKNQTTIYQSFAWLATTNWDKFSISHVCFTVSQFSMQCCWMSNILQLSAKTYLPRKVA